ncbi:MAG: YcxB family protein [Planctomycetes bacterium]|nr:YcxB family protein [Planctomycetota bacterium]
MKKSYESTIDEATQARFRLAEVAGALSRQKGHAFFWVLPVFAYFYQIDPSASLGKRLTITALMSAGLIVLHLLIYKELVRRGIRKALAKALGSDQSIPSEYELDDDGLAFRQLGNEVRFSWANVVEVNDRKNAVEIVVKPTAIAIIPKRIFDGADDLQKWIKFIEDRRELNNREDENTVT